MIRHLRRNRPARIGRAELESHLAGLHGIGTPVTYRRPHLAVVRPLDSLRIAVFVGSGVLLKSRNLHIAGLGNIVGRERDGGVRHSERCLGTARIEVLAQIRRRRRNRPLGEHHVLVALVRGHKVKISTAQHRDIGRIVLHILADHTVLHRRLEHLAPVGVEGHRAAQFADCRTNPIQIDGIATCLCRPPTIEHGVSESRFLYGHPPLFPERLKSLLTCGLSTIGVELESISPRLPSCF